MQATIQLGRTQDKLRQHVSIERINVTSLEEIGQPLLEVNEGRVVRHCIVYHDHLIAVVGRDRHGMPVAGCHD